MTFLPLRRHQVVRVVLEEMVVVALLELQVLREVSEHLAEALEV